MSDIVYDFYALYMSTKCLRDIFVDMLSIVYYIGSDITLYGKFVQLIPNRILETFGLHHFIEGAFLLKSINFRPIGSFPS